MVSFMAEPRTISIGNEFSKSVSELLGGALVKSASIKHESDTMIELTVTIHLTTEQEKQLLGKE